MRYWIVKTSREDTSYESWLRKNGQPQPEGTNHTLVKQRPGKGDRCFYWSTAPERQLRALGTVVKTDSTKKWKLRAFIRPATGEFTMPLNLQQLRLVKALRNLAFINAGYPATFYALTDDTARLLYQLCVVSNPLYKGTWTDIPQASRLATAAWRKMERAAGPMKLLTTPDRGRDETKMQVLVVRKGQPTFRKLLLAAAGARCEITGCQIPTLLDACHVRGYSQSGRYSLGNGLLLRKDIHALLDSGLIRIDPDSRKLMCSKVLRGTEYGKLQGRRLPRRLNGEEVAVGALRHLWRQTKSSARSS